MIEKPYTVVIFTENHMGGVLSWAYRLRQYFDSECYRLIFIEWPLYAKTVAGDFDEVAHTEEDALNFLRQYKPDVVVPNYHFQVFDLLIRLQKEGQFVPAVGFVRAHEPVYYDNVAWADPLIGAFATVSPECADVLAQRLPHRSESIFIRPAGVILCERERLSLGFHDHSCIRLIYAGRIIQHQKRVLDLVELASKLHSMGVAYELTIVGPDHGSLTELKQAISDSGQGQSIKIIPPVSGEKMKELYLQNDLLVLVSEYEGTSNSMLEGMACGLIPVVTHGKSGIDSVIRHGVNGLIVPVGDMASMANEIKQLRAGGYNLSALKEAVAETIQTYSMEIYCKDFEGILDVARNYSVSTWPRKHDTKCPSTLTRQSRKSHSRKREGWLRRITRICFKK